MPVARKRKIIGVSIAGVLLFAVLGLGYFYVIPPANIDYPLDANRLSGAPAGENPADRDNGGPRRSLAEKYAAGQMPEKKALSLEDRLVKELRELYGDTIAQKSTQAILLKVKRFLMDLYPEDGDIRFANIIKRAFPDLAEEILRTLLKMEAYNRWVEANKYLLDDMNALERQGALWKQRRARFGDAADDIWTEEKLAYEQRKQDMRETLSLLDKSYDTTIEEKLDIYKSSLNQAYKDSPEAYVLENKDMLAKVFFGIDAVQDEIKQMTPEERQWEINQIRRELGYTEAQIQSTQAIDERRDKRWENGLAYMKERRAMVGQFDGPELEAQLQKLREKYFKHEAKTIMLEEKDGFYRYERERVYGRN